MRLLIRRFILLLALLAPLAAAQAQSTRVRGVVRNAATGEPIPFASVFFPGTTVGVSTDMEGFYSLETRDTSRNVQAESLGFIGATRACNTHSFNRIDFELTPESRTIEEVVIRPGDNPALPILEGVNRFKRRNNPEEFERYACSTYTKMELDLQNIKPYFRNKRLQRNFGFIFENMDTSLVTGKAFLPVMISETKADFYHNRQPSLRREVIRANRISGIRDNLTLAQFTGHLHSDVNLYENFIDIFNLKFPSPLSPSGQLYYKYFLVDSSNQDGRKTYKIRFHPRSLAVPVLDGEVNIDSATYALQSARVNMAKGVNVNWIRHLVIECENRPLNDTLWFKKQDRISADFSIVLSDSSKMTSFLGSRQVNYSDVRIGGEIPAEILRMDNNVVVTDEVTQGDERFWDSVRPYALSRKEQAIYDMVDSIQHVPLYRNIYTIISTIFGGYYNTKYVGLGPYYKVLSHNNLEGWRLQLGARTTTDVSRRVRLSSYMAYGTRNERFQGGGTLEAVFRRQLTRKLTFSFRHDVLQLGAAEGALSDNNILSSALSRGNSRRLSPVNQWDLSYRHEWVHGLSTTFGAHLRNVKPNRYVPMFAPDGAPFPSVNSACLSVGMRISKDEMLVRSPFDVRSLGSPYPIFDLDFTAGVKGVLRNDYEFYRLEGRMHYRLDLPPIGYSRITVAGGKIFGRVPYPLLKLHEGNATYFYDAYAFSCMNFYEFASDAWVALFYEHHFNGFLLGRIPLLKKLKLREVFIFKAVYGTLTDRNNGSLLDTRAVMLFPPGMSSVSHPYMETGFGIENILRLVRLDFIWRLTHRAPEPGQDIQRFAVNVSLDLKF